MNRLAVALCCLALAACSTITPEQKVRRTLIDAGLSQRMAGCMAGRMVDRLSIGQLLKLRSLARLPGRGVSDMSVDEFLHRLRALDDPEILGVVSRAGIGCALAG